MKFFFVENGVVEFIRVRNVFVHLCVFIVVIFVERSVVSTMTSTINADYIQTANTSVSIGTASTTFAEFSSSRVIIGEKGANTTTSILVGDAENDLNGDNLQFRQTGIFFNEGNESQLGSRTGYLSEPSWEFTGGSLGLKHVNASTGGAVSFHFRVNENDELEIVKKVQYPNSTPVYQQVFKTGRANAGPMKNPVSKDRGIIEITNVSLSGGTANVQVKTFSAFYSYKIHASVFDKREDATTSLILDSQSAFQSSQKNHGTTFTTNFQLDSDFESRPIQSRSFVAVIIQETTTGLATVNPVTMEII